MSEYSVELAYDIADLVERQAWSAGELIELITESGWLAAHDREVAATALREAAEDMNDTDDPDDIYVANGDVDVWLRARAERIEAGE